MKTKLTLLFLALSAGFALAHGGVELGPNGGRLLEFSKDESMHGEVTAKDGKFAVALLDKDQKPVAVAAQSLTATTGTGAKPEKLAVEKTATGFSLPAVKDGQTIILQFRENEKAKPVTARFKYDTGNCEECSSPEWLCKCSEAKEGADKKEAPKKK
ncbi:MAG: hypothetical protein JWL81_3147 [Verrucomicrobiales bacterium]|nr:hypothetical protein [Verrucomicrobiales bacterium]